MTETRPVDIAGLIVEVLPLTSNHYEAIARIQRSLTLAGEDAAFSMRQVGRLGDLIDGLIPSELHRELLDQKFLRGEIGTGDMLRAVLSRPIQDAEEAAVAAEPVKRARKTAAKVAKRPVKRAPRAAQ